RGHRVVGEAVDALLVQSASRVRRRDDAGSTRLQTARIELEIRGGLEGADRSEGEIEAVVRGEARALAIGARGAEGLVVVHVLHVARGGEADRRVRAEVLDAAVANTAGKSGELVVVEARAAQAERPVVERVRGPRAAGDRPLARRPLGAVGRAHG